MPWVVQSAVLNSIHKKYRSDTKTQMFGIALFHINFNTDQFQARMRRCDFWCLI